MAASMDKATNREPQVSEKVLTLPNVISFIRLCLVPVYLVLLLRGYDLAACFLFALAAGTDWVDGQIARRTNSVSKLGQLLDPAVDRILMVAGVVGVLIVDRIPVWIVLVVVARDLFLAIGGAWLIRTWHIRVPVIYPGKFATTFLFVGFAALLLNMPLIPGLGWVDASWLPGFNHDMVCWGIWFVYAGLVLALGTTAYYVVTAWRKLQEAKARVREA